MSGISKSLIKIATLRSNLFWFTEKIWLLCEKPQNLFGKFHFNYYYFLVNSMPNVKLELKTLRSGVVCSTDQPARTPIYEVFRSKSSPRIKSGMWLSPLLATGMLGGFGRVNQIPSCATNRTWQGLLFWAKERPNQCGCFYHVTVYSDRLYWQTDFVSFTRQWMGSPNKAGRLRSNNKVLLNIYEVISTY